MIGLVELGATVYTTFDAAHLFRHAERLVGYATCASPFNAGAWVLSPKRDSYGALDDLLTRNFNACYGATPRGHGTLGRLQVTRAWERRGFDGGGPLGEWASDLGCKRKSAAAERRWDFAASCSCQGAPYHLWRSSYRTLPLPDLRLVHYTNKPKPWAQTDADPLDLAGVAGATFNRSLPCWFLWWGEFDRSPLAVATAAPPLECAARLRRRRAALDGALAAARRAGLQCYTCRAGGRQLRLPPCGKGKLRDGHHVPYSCTLLASANSSHED